LQGYSIKIKRRDFPGRLATGSAILTMPAFIAGWTCGKNGQSVPVSQGMPTVLVSRMIVGNRNA